MRDVVSFREMRPGEEQDVNDLVVRVFDQFIAPSFSAEGRQEFYRCVSADRILRRAQTGHFVLLAWQEDIPVGMIEVQQGSRVSLFYVEGDFQGQGIGRELFSRARLLSAGRYPDIRRMDVHSSTYAVPIYERLGFHQTGGEQVEHGMKYVPMEMEVS